MSNFIPVDNRLGLENISSNIDSTPAFTPSTGTAPNNAYPVGTIVKAYDTTLGYGEFIYLPGVASNFIGAIVSYDVAAAAANTGVVTLATRTVSLGAPLAVSMAANTATTSFSWYQIEGPAVIKKTAVKVVPSAPMYLSGTAARATNVASAGFSILGLRSTNAATVASATSTLNVILDRPHMQLIT